MRPALSISASEPRRCAVSRYNFTSLDLPSIRFKSSRLFIHIEIGYSRAVRLFTLVTKNCWSGRLRKYASTFVANFSLYALYRLQLAGEMNPAAVGAERARVGVLRTLFSYFVATYYTQVIVS